MRSVIEMAREAGFTIEGNHPHHPQRIHGYDRDGEYTQELECFAALVRADEFESCARLCDARVMGDNNREDMEAKRCAADIRSFRSRANR